MKRGVCFSAILEDVVIVRIVHRYHTPNTWVCQEGSGRNLAGRSTLGSTVRSGTKTKGR